MSIRLIVNADDYGRDDDVSLGIRQAHLQGIVTSTTTMMNMSASDANLQLALRESPRLGLGVHLVLTSGKPLLPSREVSTLVDETGAFLRPNALRTRLDRIDPAHVLAEWRAQIDKFIRATGRKPTHLDSHHHSSYYSRMLFHCMLTLASELDCPIRRPNPLVFGTRRSENGEVVRESYFEQLMAEFKPRTPHWFIDTFYDEQATKPVLVDIINHLKEGNTEVMCHPGYVGETLLAASIYNHQREKELEILCDPELKHLIQAKDIQLISYAGI